MSEFQGALNNCICTSLYNCAVHVVVRPFRFRAAVACCDVLAGLSILVSCDLIGFLRRRWGAGA